MHSRIYQITTSPVKKKDYIGESDFYEHPFTNEIADYVDEDSDRPEDLCLLQDCLKGTAVFESADSFSILPEGKETYFAKAYEVFTEALRKAMKLSLTDFASNGPFSETVWAMKNSFCDKFGYYVSSDEFDTIPLDEFIRAAETGKTYYVGATLDYHY